MLFSLLIAIGLGLLIAASMSRQLTFRGGKIVAVLLSSLLALAVTSFMSGGDLVVIFAAALSGAVAGTVLASRN